MQHTSRRSFLRNGLALGAGASLGLPWLGQAFAAETQTLVLYNGQHPKTTQALIDAFTKASGIQVDMRKGKSTQLANQIIEEGERSPADVFFSEESPPAAALGGRGILAPLPESITSQIIQRYVSKDKTWVGITARCRVTVYNRDLVQESELPVSVLDMATETWKGRVGFVPTSGAFQEQIIAIKLLHGRETALNWLKGLKEYGSIYNGNMAAMRAVERGEIATALINNYYWYIVANELGVDNMRSALYFSGPKDAGSLVTLSAAGILKTAGNRAAAEKFLAYMVSQEGQEVIASTAAEYPLRPGVVSPFNLKPFDELDPPELDPTQMGDAAEALALRREAGLA